MTGCHQHPPVNKQSVRHMAYLSDLAPGQGYEVFASVCRAARARHRCGPVCGLLLFDGQSFFQWLHGPDEAVMTLMGRIAEDARHTHLRMCLDETGPVLPSSQSWRSGFVDSDLMAAVTPLLLGRRPADVFAAIGWLCTVADLDGERPHAAP